MVLHSPILGINQQKPPPVSLFLPPVKVLQGLFDTEDSVQAVETIPEGEASSTRQLFPSFD